MKKTLIALMALAGVAAAAEWVYETPTITSGSYELKMDNWTTGDSTLYDYLYGVFVEGGTLTFNLDINYTGTNCSHYQALLHVGQQNTGFSIFANGGPNIIVSPKHSTDGGYELSTNLGTGSSTVAITLAGNAQTQQATATATVNGKAINESVTLSWDAMDWNTNNGEAAKYSINKVAPGYSGNYENKPNAETLIRPANTTTLTSGSVAFTAGTGKAILVPEPATATLSLLALAGLCARRRRG